MPVTVEIADAVASAAREGLSASPKSLQPWLFYDETGSQLFERITELPEYYLTRTERAIFAEHAKKILHLAGPAVTVVELGAGTATKTGLLLSAATEVQGEVLYQPIDVSPTALEEARESIERRLPGVRVKAQVANYITERIQLEREPKRPILVLYIGSSIGNFTPEDATTILRKLRLQLRSGDSLLLGTDLAPSAQKSVAELLAAYNDANGVTAAFNLNVLRRLNREIGADFAAECFEHEARWNARESRIEMHLCSLTPQTVTLPGGSPRDAIEVRFRTGETIHTENSYKFTERGISRLLGEAGFEVTRTFADPRQLFAVTLAVAV